MAKLEAYDKALDYSYAPGIFPATECLKNAKKRCMRLLVSSNGLQSEGVQALERDAQEAGVRVEVADRALERISKKENCFAAMVYKKAEGRFDEDSPHIVLHHPSDSGNLGTILRTALGFGLKNPFMLTGAVPLDEAVQKVDGPFSLVFGNEASGLPDAFAQMGVSTLIPHSHQIDSLNLAIAAGIGMYAFTRR